MMDGEVLELEGVLPVPLLGEVAAGQPLEVYTIEETVDVPRSLWEGRRVFALRVRGSSMIDAGIHDGDYLIVEPCDHADDGRTVVAEVDGRVTVKKLYRQTGGEVRLQPANPEMLPLVTSAADVRIRGVVVGILRKYGFQKPPRSAAARPARRVDQTPGESLELMINAVDAHLSRWRAAREELGAQCTSHEAERMAELERELQALRAWWDRTEKPQLRRALLREANDLMQRMDRFLAARQLHLPELTLH